MKLRFLIYFYIVMAGLFVIGCGGGTIDGEGSESSFAVDVDSPGFKAFESGFYAYSKTQGCVKCHGVSTNPRFVVSDVVAAYRNARGRVGAQILIDFNNPASSPYILYAGNGHCVSTPCSDPANSPLVQGLLQTWATAELTAPAPTPGGGATPTPTPGPMVTIFTSTVALPATIPTVMAANPALIRFPLSQLKPAVSTLSNAILEVEVQMINPTEYRVRSPKIVGNRAVVTLTGIHVYTRPASGAGIGVEDMAQGLAWVKTAPTAAIVALPNPIPVTRFIATSLESISLGIYVQSATDVMTIGFESIK